MRRAEKLWILGYICVKMTYGDILSRGGEGALAAHGGL